MKNVRNSIFGFLLALLSLQTVCGQDQRQPLATVLQQLEATFGVDFNYDPNLVDSVQVVPPSENQDLNASLANLSQQSGLSFMAMQENIYSVLPGQGNYKLCGYLLDKDSQQPLVYASVQADKLATITDEQGYFELEIPDKNRLISISYLGYKSIIRQAQYFKSGCEPVYMIAQQQSLSQVIIQQYLVRGIDKLNAGQYLIDFNRFSTLPGLIEADVLQAVQALPGIQSVNETVSNINIRGGSHDQNLILWDDIKMYQSGHFFGLISVFNPQMNQEVTLSKNGSAVQNTDGVSGTISMKTAALVNPKFTANAGVNLINADAFIDLPIGQNSSLQMAGRKSLSDIAKTPTFDAYFDRIAQNTEVTQQQENTINTDQDFSFYDTSLRYLYRLSDKDRIRANFILINNKLVYTENTVLDQELESRQSEISQNSIAAGINYTRDWSGGFQTQIQIYNTDYKLEAVNANIAQSQRFLQENSVSETGARAFMNWQFTPVLKLVVGYQFIETKVRNLDDVDNPVFRSLKGEVLRIHSAFGSLKWQPQGVDLSAEIGLRHNYLYKFEKHIPEPRLSVNYRFSDSFSAELLGEFKHQVTTQVINFQNDFLGVEKRRWQLANDAEIPVLESRQGSLGFSFNKEKFLVDLTGYYKMVKGITTQSQGFLNQFEFTRETGDYRAYGLDLLVRTNLWRLQLWGSYSYLDNQYDFPRLQAELFPSNFDITHTVTSGVAYDYKGFKASLGVNWHLGKPFTLPVAGQTVTEGDITYQTPNSARIEDYLRIDASAAYRFNTGNTRFQIAAAVWNLMSKSNELNRFYRVEGNEIAQVNQNSLGLVPNISARVYF